MPLIADLNGNPLQVMILDDQNREMARGYLQVEYLPAEGGNRKTDVQFVERPEERTP